MAAECMSSTIAFGIVLEYAVGCSVVATGAGAPVKLLPRHADTSVSRP